MEFFKERLREHSTWLGLFAMASAFSGINFLPEQQNAIMMLCIALLGSANVVSKG